MVLPSKVPFSPLSSQCASITIFKSAWKGPSPHGQCTQLWRWQIVCDSCMQRFLLSAATFHSARILWIVSFSVLYVDSFAFKNITLIWQLARKLGRCDSYLWNLKTFSTDWLTNPLASKKVDRSAVKVFIYVSISDSSTSWSPNSTDLYL